MQFYTLNQLINLFEAISNSHDQVHGFNFGQVYDISASEQENYALVWIDIVDSAIDGSVLTVSVLMRVLDIQKDDQSNMRDTLSDTLSISQDIYAELCNPAYQDYFILQKISTLTPIREGLPDKVNGYEMTLSFQFMQDANRCQVPLSGEVTPPVATCPVATAILQNSQGTTIITEAIPSGVTEIIPLPDEDYVVNVNGVEVSTGSFPVYGTVTIDIDL